MRRLFEGGVTNAKTLAAGGDYSRAATIRGRRLIDEIRYLTFFQLGADKWMYCMSPDPFQRSGLVKGLARETSKYPHQAIIFFSFGLFFLVR